MTERIVAIRVLTVLGSASITDSDQSELAAERLVDPQGVIEHRIVNLDLDELGGSALTDKIWRFLKRDGRYSCYLCSSEKYRVSVLRLSH